METMYFVERIPHPRRFTAISQGWVAAQWYWIPIPTRLLNGAD